MTTATTKQEELTFESLLETTRRRILIRLNVITLPANHPEKNLRGRRWIEFGSWSAHRWSERDDFDTLFRVHQLILDPPRWADSLEGTQGALLLSPAFPTYVIHSGLQRRQNAIDYVTEHLNEWRRIPGWLKQQEVVVTVDRKDETDSAGILLLSYVPRVIDHLIHAYAENRFDDTDRVLVRMVVEKLGAFHAANRDQLARAGLKV